MSTARSKYLRELDEVRDKLDRALSNNERDQSMRDKILNGAKAEILTLSNKVSNQKCYNGTTKKGMFMNSSVLSGLKSSVLDPIKHML